MRIVILSAALALAACQTKPVEPQTPPTIPSARNIAATAAWVCENGTAFTAVYKVGDGEVELHFADGAVLKLPEAEAASGAKFADARHEFWSKGEEATYTLGRAMPVKCVIAK